MTKVVFDVARRLQQIADVPPAQGDWWRYELNKAGEEVSSILDLTRRDVSQASYQPAENASLKPNTRKIQVLCAQALAT